MVRGRVGWLSVSSRAGVAVAVWVFALGPATSAVGTRVGRRGTLAAALGHAGVVEHVPADVCQGFGLALRSAALVDSGRPGLGVDHRGDRVVHGGVVDALP